MVTNSRLEKLWPCQVGRQVAGMRVKVLTSASAVSSALFTSPGWSLCLPDDVQRRSGTGAGFSS
jgi:hypothetical protein